MNKPNFYSVGKHLATIICVFGFLLFKLESYVGLMLGHGVLEKKEVGFVGLCFNRVPPRMIVVGLQFQPQLVPYTITAIFSARVPTPSTR